MAIEDAAGTGAPPAPAIVPASDQHFSSIVGLFLVGSLRQEGGEELVEAVLQEAGETRSPDELCDPMEWNSYDQTRRLFEAARRVTGNRARMFQVGEYGLQAMSSSAYLEMFHAIGSPSALLGRIDEMSTLTSTISTGEAVELGPCDWRITGTIDPGFEPFRDLCWFMNGLMTLYPRYYGFGPAQVVEETCQCEGADACRYRITWSEDRAVQEGSEHFEFLSTLLAARLGELQRSVAELVAGDDLETILATIVASARRAVNVQAYVLALETLPAATRRVYSDGLDGAEAERLAERLLAGDSGGDRTLVSRIRSARRSYGLLAAVDPTGTRNFMPEERAVLDAYASVAAAALEVATSLDDARREARAAEAMSEMLANERTLLSAIVEGLPHGVCWVGNSGEIEGCNLALVDLLGYTGVDEVKGRSWAELARDGTAAERIDAWTATVTSGEPVINEELAVGPVDDRRVVLVSVVPLVSVTGERGLLSLWADVTTQRSLEQRLAETSRLESIGQLAAGIAHEINTPMQYIGDNGAFLGKAFGLFSSLVDDLLDLAGSHGVDQASLEGLTSKAKLELLRSRIPNATAQVSEGVEAVSRIVRSLKTFAHPGGDEFERVELGQILESTITVSRPEWRYVAELDLNLGDDLPPVRAVPGMINQVALNLIVNAAHAIDGRREAEGSDELGRIAITGRVVDGAVEVAVADDGGGIPDDIRDKVYDQFFTTKPLGKGSGQGLAICRNIITRHGGTVDFTTSPAGTTFTVRLPIWEPPTEAGGTLPG